MKIAIYTICKNEEHFVERFMQPLSEADRVIVTDTGSTDNTVAKLRELGATVHEIKMDPWRFDVPRNISMQFVPMDIDVCVCIDLDEVLTPGWRAAIEKAWTPQTTRMRYPYVWSVKADGTPGVTFWYDKIHLRKGYRWVKPVHEVLNYYDGEEVQTYCDGFTLTHYPDQTKSRSSYLPLLELGCKESPEDDRNSHYLGREYMFYNMPEKAIVELQRHLSLKKALWDAERSASMRYISKCYLQLNNFDEAERWALKGCGEAPGEREPWIQLGKVYYSCGNFSGAYASMKRALMITERPKSYICEPESWGDYPHDIAAVMAFRMGMNHEAVDQAKIALSLNPQDERLQKNVQLMLSKIE